MCKLLFVLLCLSYTITVKAQPLNYSTANAHSHNDYAQDTAFLKAYSRQFGSMEADIFLQNNNDTLWVAHTFMELATAKRSLESLYLQPLSACIKKNKGFVYADTTKKLQLLIDIKTAAIPTLDRLINVLRQYPDIINTRSVQIVISGNRPEPAQFPAYPSFIWFDGNMNTTYSEAALAKIALMSASLTQYSLWKGDGELPSTEFTTLQLLIKKIHALHKPVRFWAIPDNTVSWQTFMKLGVDYINTDRIHPLADFLKSATQ